jgi:hypothetical protein
MGVGWPVGVAGLGLGPGTDGFPLGAGCGPETPPPGDSGTGEADGDGVGPDCGSWDGAGLADCDPIGVRLGDCDGIGVGLPDCRWERGASASPALWCDVVASAMPMPLPMIVTVAGSPISHMRLLGKLIMSSS